MAKKTEAERQEQKNQIKRDNNAKSADVAPIPKIAKPKRREACRENFRLFCETYYPEVFCLEWSDDHLKVIAIIEDAVLRGGLAAIAMPRGSGKSALCMAAAVWALLFGHRRFVVVIGASEDASKDLLDDTKLDLETNELLMADFPEVCHPIRRLEGQVNRAKSQHCAGARTRIGWTGKEIVLPTVKDSKCSGSLLKVAGITGRIRGMKSTLITGEQIRPDLVIVDDPQTDESAASKQQVQKRMRAITGAVLGLAGPGGKKIAGFAAVTVIEPEDVADQMLDHKANPRWRGTRTQMLRSLPTNHKRWDEYAEIWARGFDVLSKSRDLSEATKFYVEHREELDAGAEASWPARFDDDEASAIQHAMNLKLTNEQVFWAEYQNAPMSTQSAEAMQLTTPQLTSKIVKTLKKGIVPDSATTLTAMIDVHQDVLYWTVVAFSAGFRGHVVSYGTWPEQKKLHYGMADLTHTIRTQPETRGQDFDAQLYHALKTCTDMLLKKQWHRETKDTLSIGRMLIDVNWGPATQLVRLFIKQHEMKRQIIGSQGKAVSAREKPMSEYRHEDGVRGGDNWRWNAINNHIRFDVYHWKTFVFDRAMTAMGGNATMTFFDGSAFEHRLFFEHLASEYGHPTFDKVTQRTVNVWSLHPNRENHWLDCLIGCCVGASVEGMKTETFEMNTAKKKKRGALRIAA